MWASLLLWFYVLFVEFLKINPIGYVPALVDGDFVVSDSFAILKVSHPFAASDFRLFL